MTPSRLKAYVSPVLPARAMCKISLNSSSGRIRKPSAATTFPSAAKIGAQANIVGTPAFNWPFFAGKSVARGSIDEVDLDIAVARHAHKITEQLAVVPC